MGLWWRIEAARIGSNSEEAWGRARDYLLGAIEQLELGNYLDLVARYINPLGEILQQLGAWEELEKVVGKAAILHRTYPDPISLAHDKGLAAEIAIARSRWTEAKQLAEEALAILANAELIPSVHPSRYLLSSARARINLGEKKAAASNLETAREQHNPQENVHLHIRILAELGRLYFARGDYGAAFEIKQQRELVEYRFGLRAFLGAARLQPQSIDSDKGLQEGKGLKPLVWEGFEGKGFKPLVSGRERDLKRLLERVGRSDCKLTVLHGQSGVGKSSLVEAGLIPALKEMTVEARRMVPALQRVYPDWVEELGQCLTDAFAGTGMPPTRDPHSTVGILARLKECIDRNLGIVLIFDQFEEFFFTCKDPEQRRPFYQFLRECLDIPYVKVIVSLREDYLHYLLECNGRLVGLDVINNNILDKKILYYLGNFSPTDGKEVIRSLTARTRVELESALIDKLVEDLGGELGEVRPIELQVVGAQLERESIATLELYRQSGTKEELVDRYLGEVVRDCGPENEQIAKLVLYLLTDENNVRPLKTRADLELELDVPGAKLDLVVDILVRSGIVLRVPAFPTERYQLVHDYLVPFVRQQQSKRLIEELEREREERKLTEKKLNAVLKEQLEYARRSLVWMVGLGAIAGGLLFFLPFVVANQNNTHLREMIIKSERFLSSNQDLQALVEALKAGKKVQRWKMVVDAETKMQAIASLQDVVYTIREKKQFRGTWGKYR